MEQLTRKVQSSEKDLTIEQGLDGILITIWNGDKAKTFNIEQSGKVSNT